MTTALVPRATWLGSAALSVMRALRLVNVIEEPEEDDYNAGSDFASGLPQAPRYDPRRAMSALPANPWLAAAVNARASDLSGVPLVVEVDGVALQEGDETRAQVLALFPRLLRMQLLADLDLTGNAFALALRGFGAPSKVTRLHPARVEVVPGPSGDADGYLYQGAGDQQSVYQPGDVCHIRSISWEDDPSGLYGTGAIQSLDADIVADRNLANASARSAAKGRPDAVYHPAKEGETWNPRQMASMRAQVDQMLQRNEGGVAILNGMGKMEILGWSPKDMEGVAQRNWTRETILARLGVPGTRVGLPDANYATALAQMVIYWTNLKAAAALLEDCFTAVARMIDDRIRIRHDFSQVPALQASQTEALNRVTMHVQNGMSPLAAYTREGFTGLEAGDFVSAAAPAEAPDAPDAPDAEDDTTDEAPDLSLVPGATLAEAVEELASALAILTDPEATDADKADALLSIEVAQQALADEQSNRRRGAA